MKAIVHNEYGAPDVLELVDVDKPVPSAEEILVRVRGPLEPVKRQGMHTQRANL